MNLQVLLPLFIGCRYIKSRRVSGFVSLSALFSVLGITIGIMVLVTVMSVMNGFNYEIRRYLFNVSNHITITEADNHFDQWSAVAKQLSQQKYVRSVSPYVSGQALLTFHGNTQAVSLNGVMPQYFLHNDHHLHDPTALPKKGHYDLLVTQNMADMLHLQVGDRVTIVVPQANVTAIGVVPRYRQFTIHAILRPADVPWGDYFVYTDMRDSQILFNQKNTVTGIYAAVNNVYDSPQITASLRNILDPRYQVRDWTDDFVVLFKTLQLQKTMMAFILFFIIMVAIFNLISSLVMMVVDKRANIAVLRTYGMTARSIMLIFIAQGVIIGILSIVVGSALGIVLSYYISAIAAWLETILHMQFISPDAYIIDFLPSKLRYMDLVYIDVTTLIISLLSALYPAWKAAGVEPATELKYQ